MRLNDLWGSRNPAAIALLPASWLFRGIVWLRRGFYRRRNRSGRRLPVPVIVVGNLTVGGTGKTPLVIALAELLKSRGYRPGIVSRGYGGRADRWPQVVTADSDPAQVGDEPVLIAARSGCPVVAAPDRRRAAEALLERGDCDVVVADDGLQHYNLMRDIEIAVLDGVRRLGNGWCLPAGPLREPPARLRDVDFIVVNGAAGEGEYALRLHGDTAVNLCDPRRECALAKFRGGVVHAVAGIGQPDRFFDFLRANGLEIDAHPFPDHHPYSPADLAFDGDWDDDRPVLMTEKDAVKCRPFARESHWFVPVAAELDAIFTARLLERLRRILDGQETARNPRLPCDQGAADL